MRPPQDPDIELVCTGSRVHWGRNMGMSERVAQTPREVRELMRTSEDDMVDLSHIHDREVPVYVNRNEIVAIVPYWTRVEE